MANILIVDDDPEVLGILDITLTDAGHHVIPATSGVNALDILEKEESLDLLLTDVVMPGLNGFNLARMARNRLPFIKVLYLTGFHEQSVAMRDQGDKLGKLLTKPILPDDLADEVHKVLQARHAE